MRPLRTTALAAVTLALAGCGASTVPARTSGATAVSISVSACGVGWAPQRAGPQRIRIRDTDSRAGEAQLIDPSTGAVFADVEPLGPGTTTGIDVDLAAGRYAWRCLMEDEPALTGRTVTITGRAAGAVTPGVRPVSQADLVAPTQAYERFVRERLPKLVSLVDALRGDVARGDLAAARAAWFPAHLVYERLGAAYGAFGRLDVAINGLPFGLTRGVRDRHWLGFHRIEYGLWHAEPATALAPVTDRLARSVRKLLAQFTRAEIDPAQLAIRAHEISENALQFELTGRTDFGSHSQLATVRANLAGTAEVLRLVRGLLAHRDAALPATLALLRRSIADVDAQRRGRTWRPLQDLERSERERIDSDLSALCESLAPIASILEPRRTA